MHHLLSAQQGDQLDLSNQSLSRAISMKLSSATQNMQPADHSTSVVTSAGGRLKWSCSASHCEESEVPCRVGSLVKCTGVGCG